MNDRLRLNARRTKTLAPPQRPLAILDILAEVSARYLLCGFPIVMSLPEYQRALNRSDLSQWVVHFVRPAAEIYPGHLGNAGDILSSIFTEGVIRPSLKKHVTRFCPEGAACFYDAPPSVWPEIVNTNPNRRPALGIICHKNTIWALGGHPVIYTDHKDPTYWPEPERFRIVYTDLLRWPQPADYMHEREWRVRGSLSLSQPYFKDDWWWPIVPNDEWGNYLFRTYSTIDQIYVITQNRVVNRNAA